MEQGDLPLASGAATSRKWLVSVDDVMSDAYKRHGVTMRRDDPSLILISAWELVAQKMVGQFMLAAERANDDTSALLQTQLEKSKEAGANYVDAAMGYQAERLKALMPELAEQLAKETRKLLEQVGQEVGATREKTNMAMKWAIAASALAVGSTLFTVGMLVARATT